MAGAGLLFSTDAGARWGRTAGRCLVLVQFDSERPGDRAAPDDSHRGKSTVSAFGSVGKAVGASGGCGVGTGPSIGGARHVGRRLIYPRSAGRFVAMPREKLAPFGVCESASGERAGLAVPGGGADVPAVGASAVVGGDEVGSVGCELG